MLISRGKPGYDFRRWLTIVIAVASIVCGFIIIGCTTKEDGSTTETANENTPFATPEALVQRITALMERDQPDLESYYALVYAENQAQRDYLRFTREWTIPLREVDRATRRRFGTGMFDEVQEDTVSPLYNVQVAQVSEGRATAVYNTRSGEQRELHLVRIELRWWISGYSWEYRPDFDAAAYAEAADGASGLGQKIRRLLERLEVGEFESPEEIKEAFHETLSKHNIETLEP